MDGRTSIRWICRSITEIRRAMPEMTRIMPDQKKGTRVIQAPPAPPGRLVQQVPLGRLVRRDLRDPKAIRGHKEPQAHKVHRAHKVRRGLLVLKALPAPSIRH